MTQLEAFRAWQAGRITPTGISEAKRQPEPSAKEVQALRREIRARRKVTLGGHRVNSEPPGAPTSPDAGEGTGAGYAELGPGEPIRSGRALQGP